MTNKEAARFVGEQIAKLAHEMQTKEDLLFLPVKGDIYRIYEPERGFAVPSDAVRIDIPLWKFNENTVKRYDVSKISILLPRVITTAEEEDIKRQLEKAKKLGIRTLTESEFFAMLT